jgi:hypothetical protein
VIHEAGPAAPVAPTPVAITPTPAERDTASVSKASVLPAPLREAPPAPAARDPALPDDERPSASSPSQPSTTAPSSSTAAPARLGEELALIQSAVAALHRRDAAAALAALDDYARRFSDGELAPEATALRIEAMFAIGHSAEARALAARFLADHADSPLAQRVRNTIRAQPP